ncbi:DUF736 domain-containing protein [Sphingomonadaceae bacterium]|nr:DUF736 domain-containing protein [Sphingomonadaceae bacterium]
MNIGNLKANNDGVLMGRITTLNFSAVIALREVQSSNERAPRFDMLALSANSKNWVKVGALWAYNSTGTGEEFLSGRIDDPSLATPLDVAMFRQEDGTYNASWRRPQTRRAVPDQQDDSGTPPLPGAGEEDQVPAGSGDGLGESTAGTRGNAKNKAMTDA